MMPCRFINKSGTVGQVDLDAVVDVARGPSGRKPAWEALVIYDPKTDLLIELRDSPVDCAHGTPDEAEEVEREYVQKHFGLSEADLNELRQHPKRWRLDVNRKSGA
ncbi:hypothetical protein [Crenobacter cavernae]|uniref:hypothetical protein n=1 Tax=Crenobacter cavernae TaxID=2290923 RepID=UPI0011C03966|nr:hypothetical protein [Crenobacter cavernae]